MGKIDIDAIAERIKYFRTQHGIGQRELARRAGIEQKTLSRIEAGETKLVSEHLNSLATALGLKLNDPLGEKLETVRVKGRPLPVWDHVQAGIWAGVDPTLRDEENLRWVTPSEEYSEGSFAMEVKGDSMLPRFPEGCIVIVDPELSHRTGRFVVAKNDGGEATIKQYADRGVNPDTGLRRFELRPLNPLYRTMSSEEEVITILGVVAEKIERTI